MEENKDQKDPIDDVEMTKDQLMQLLLDQVNHSANLPPHVRHAFVTYIDFESMILLIYSILKKIP